MDINDTTEVVGVEPRITADGFARLLRERRSPAAGEAEASWRAVADQGVDPLFALAVFHQESQFGIDGICAQHGTRSPGNTRSSRTGVGTVIETALGPFVRYPSWVEGWRDLARRLVDPNYVYHKEKRRTIRRIIECWAPKGDFGNIPEIYIARVVGNMNAWRDGTVTDPVNTDETPNEPVVDGRVIVKPSPPPKPIDGTDKVVSGKVFHADGRTVEVAVDGLNCRKFADPTSPMTRSPMKRGTKFRAVYWVEGVNVDGEARWWVTKSGSRVWAGGTVQKPGG